MLRDLLHKPLIGLLYPLPQFHSRPPAQSLELGDVKELPRRPVGFARVEDDLPFEPDYFTNQLGQGADVATP